MIFRGKSLYKAVDFYKKMGYTFEKYDYMVPYDCDVEKTQVCSKAISDEEPVPWNNRPMYFDTDCNWRTI